MLSIVFGAAKDYEQESAYDFVLVVYCVDRKAAKYVQNDFDVFIQQDIERIFNLGGGVCADNFCTVRKGKIVIFGWQNAVECLT